MMTNIHEKDVLYKLEYPLALPASTHPEYGVRF